MGISWILIVKVSTVVVKAIVVCPDASACEAGSSQPRLERIPAISPDLHIVHATALCQLITCNHLEHNCLVQSVLVVSDTITGLRMSKIQSTTAPTPATSAAQQGDNVAHALSGAGGGLLSMALTFVVPFKASNY